MQWNRRVVRLAGAISLPLMVLVGTVGMTAVSSSVSAQAEAPKPGAYKVDGVHSSVIFKCQRMSGAPFYGMMKKIEGSFLIDAEKLDSSFVEVTIPTNSIDSNNEGRNRHLMSADFFSAEEFPNLTFKSKSITKTADKTFEVKGDLTVRGTTKPVTITMKETGSGPTKGGVAIGYEVGFSIKRGDFGVNYGAGALGEDIQIMAGLEGVRK